MHTEVKTKRPLPKEGQLAVVELTEPPCHCKTASLFWERLVVVDRGTFLPC